MAKGLLYDATQCVGCLECEVACAKQNEAQAPTLHATGHGAGR